MEKNLDDLLEALRDPRKVKLENGEPVLENTAETWSRIGSKDSFDELGFDSASELESFLTEWCAENEYNNI